jgi:hypothetical protein
MIYGNPIVHTDNDTTDFIGIRTLVLSKIWQPTRDDLSQDEIDAERPSIPPVPGGVLLVGDQTRRLNGVMRSTWTFEGIQGDGKRVTFKDRNNSLDYRFEPGFSQVTMAYHPDIEKLLEEFGGYVVDGEVVWPSEMPPEDTSANKGLNSKKQTNRNPNPMWGHDSFFRMEGTYRFRYAERDIPGDLFTRVGRIFQSGALPGRPPFVKDRDWLKLPPQYRRRGLIFEIFEDYWLSGAGGWPEPIYGGR